MIKENKWGQRRKKARVNWKSLSFTWTIFSLLSFWCCLKTLLEVEQCSRWMGKEQCVPSCQQTLGFSSRHRQNPLSPWPPWCQSWEGIPACLQPWEPRELSASQEMQQTSHLGLKNLENKKQRRLLHLKKALGHASWGRLWDHLLQHLRNFLVPH